MKSYKKERTDDTNLEVITGATKENLFLLRRCLFWRHPLFDGGARRKGERKGSSGGGEASEQTQSIPHFLKRAVEHKGSHTLTHTQRRRPLTVRSLLAPHEVLKYPSVYLFPRIFRLSSTAYYHQCVCCHPYLSLSTVR